MIRKLCLLSLLLLLGACSSTTLIYNRLDMLLPWYLERYVDLTRDQARAFDDQLTPLLSWHRREELPRYAVFLEDLNQALDGDFHEAQVVEITDRLEAAWYRVRDRALEELLILGGTLSDEQVDEFIAALEKRQRKYERKYLPRTDEEFREEAEDELRDFVEDYLGRLDRNQRQRIVDAVAQLQRSDDLWLSERAHWIELMARELARAPGWEERIRQIITSWESQLDAGTMAVYEQNTRVIQGALADIVNSRSEKQNRRLRRKLNGWQEDIDLLIRQGED